ncbi:DUF2512 family protein [Alteribacillus iranensis]|uniref:4 TMS phage holin, superfamily IV n=1 Tax=Alteribacillus iranensis TaxID=930128 RepID=A0A1I2DU07_9BACI|nr:DUF2512 family protein [Alteribacillus iranensis]SFE83410.1 Protein of unknown function [Alteribacillus iranensis]
MKHLVALAIKTMLVFLVLSIVLSLFNDYALWNTLGLSLIIVVAAYIIGDIFILRATNNLISTLADIGLCTLVIWLIGPLILNEPVSFGLALLTSIIVGAGEWVFHKYVARAVFPNNERAYS